MLFAWQDEISYLNSLQMGGKSPAQIKEFVLENYSQEQIQIIKDHYKKGGRRMGDSVLVAVSLI